MELGEKLEADIKQIIFAQFGEGVVQDVEIESVEVFENTTRIKILVTFEASADPNALADGFFGLTRKIRNVLDENWRDAFPIITPVIGHEAHA